MAEVSNELIYEVLKPMQRRLSNVEAEFGEIDGRLHAMSIRLDGIRNDIAAAHTGIETINQTIAHTDGRLMRIERRLDLIAEPAE